MDNNPTPEAANLPKVFYARAAKLGLWMSRDAQGTLRCDKNFDKALACESSAQAEELWAQMSSEALALANPPAWAHRGPAISPGPNPDQPMPGATVYLALCQGRFVGQKQGYQGMDWYLTPDMGLAHAFLSQESAEFTLRHALPSMAAGSVPLDACVLPLRGLFGAPVPLSGHSTPTLAAVLGQAGLRAEFHDVTSNPSTRKKTPRSL